MHYDGVSITPYETVFVPYHLGAVDNRWSFVQTAAKYEEWAEAQVRRGGGGGGRGERDRPGGGASQGVPWVTQGLGGGAASPNTSGLAPGQPAFRLWLRLRRPAA